MRLNWILPGRRIAEDLDEARLEIEWTPGIPAAVLFGRQCAPSPAEAAEREQASLTKRAREHVGNPLLSFA